MTQGWEPGVQYDLGSVVEYNHKRYRIIQPHRSQGDWTPDVTPALWGLIPGHDCGDDYKPPAPQHHQNAPSKEPWAAQPVQQVPIQQEERDKKWYDLSDERKKQLEIGGGLAAGVALLGAGFAAYKHHEKNEEEKKAVAWGAQNWLHDAQERTQRFHREGPRGPTTWVLVHGTQIPQGALQGGEADGEPLYIARAFHDGGVQVGKCGRNVGKGAVCGYGHDEIEFDTYEILLGDSNGVQWVDVRGKLNVERLGYRPVEAGRESNGTPLYIAQAQYKGQTHCGKVSEKLDCAFVTANGKERECENYRVLCYC